ncbi:MAG: CoA transferase [Anaerolineales bacterium]|nr:CoA transferase [Anaerolineales bacterium]
MNNILQGYRVLDFGRYIAGPYCAALLGHLGAEVIRIERPGGGEDRVLAPVTEQGDGALYLQMNANKLGMTLNIAKPAGRKIVKELVATADIVVANLPPQTLAALALDYDALTAVKPDIILVTNTAFGSAGSFANRVGFDGIAQAMSGAAFFTGLPGQPAKAAVQYVDYASALAAAFGTLAAVLVRERTGQGQVVETSLLATALTLTNGSLIEQAVIQANRQPTGNRAQIASPADIFATQDGHIIIQIAGPYMFKRWAELMGETHWLTDPRFKDDISRGDHRDILCERTAAWCSKRTTAEALVALEQAKIPAGPVLSFQEALDHPAVHHLEHLQPIDYPGAAQLVPVADKPVALSLSDTAVPNRAPTLGEHTVQILTKLGYTAAQIDALREERII